MTITSAPSARCGPREGAEACPAVPSGGLAWRTLDTGHRACNTTTPAGRHLLVVAAPDLAAVGRAPVIGYYRDRQRTMLVALIDPARDTVEDAVAEADRRAPRLLA